VVRLLRLAVAAVVFWGALSCGDAAAQRTDAAQLTLPNFVLNADEVTFDESRELYEAIGDVRIVQADGQVLTSDWVTFSAQTGVGVATGNVRLVDGPETLVGDFVAVNLNSGVSVAGQATLDSTSPGLIVDGDSIQRLDVNRYLVERGTLTTCRCPPEAGKEGRRPWEIEVEEADVEIGGYGVAKNLWFKTLGWPVAYFPWVIFPAKTERQTGFLMPSYGTSTRNGVELEVPFFWAAAPNLNVTAQPRLIGRRGLKYGAEYEYLFGEDGWSQGGFAVLPGDNKVDRNDPDTPYSDNRWAVWLRHEQPLGRGIRLGFNVKEVSDNNYVIDFRDLPGNSVEDRGSARHQRFLESSGWYSFAREALYAGVELSVVDDLQNPNDLDREDFFLQRLPEVRISTLPRKLGGTPLRFSVETRYDYFYQADRRDRVDGFLAVGENFFDTGQDGLFDPHEPDALGRFLGGDQHGDNALAGRIGSQFSERDGIFQEGELLADHGHRLDIYPRAYLPLRLGIFEMLSEVGYRTTFYSPDRASSEQRGLWTGRFELRSLRRFARNFDIGGGVRHVVEPQLGFAFLSTPDQRGNPLFIPASSVRLQRLIDGDLRVLTRNPSDRVPEERFLLAQVVNRFFARAEDGARGGRQIAMVNIGSGYDFLTSSTPRLFAEGWYAPSPGWVLGFDVGYDPEESELEDALFSVSWRRPRGDFLRLSYRYLRDTSLSFENFERDDDVFDRFRSGSKIRQLNIDAEWTVSRRIRLFANGYLALDDASNGDGRAGIVLLSGCGCWDVVFAVEHDTRPRETRVMVVLNLMGFGRRAQLFGYDLEPSGEDSY
jgi:lipopolysaccharide assembly outer membrane protein LptD (OstA)